MNTVFISYLKSIILFFCTLFINNANAQIIGEPDYVSVDTYILEKHSIKKDNSGYINILFSSNDCDRCIVYLVPLLKSLEELNTAIPINIITDNTAYAKKNLKAYRLNLNYVFDKEVFSKYGINLRTVTYLKHNSQIIDNVEDIINTVNNGNTSVVFQKTDSLVTEINMSSSFIAPFNSFLTLDSKMGTALLFEPVNQSYSLTYLEAKISDSLKIYNLPERTADTERKSGEKLFEKLDFKDFSYFCKTGRYKFLKITAISSFGSNVYCNFSIDRSYKEKQRENYFSIWGNDFVAVKKIKTKEDMHTIMDISTYDQIYPLMNEFEFENELYSTGVWVHSYLEFEDENTIKINVDKSNEDRTDFEFAGLATIRLNPAEQKAEMIALDKDNAEPVIKRNNQILLGNYIYSVEKEMTDEANNAGFIKITKKAVD